MLNLGITSLSVALSSTELLLLFIGNFVGYLRPGERILLATLKP